MMAPKTILVMDDGGGGSEAALLAAVKVARDFSGHLDVLHVRADPETMVPVVGEAMTGAMVEQMMEAMTRTVAARAAKAREVFDKVVAGSGLSVAWHEITGREPDILTNRGRLADLVVMSRPNGEREGPMAATLDAALFDTGRPVIVVPPKAPATLGERIAVAWNGSAQSARVLAAALPLLSRAKQVTILTGDEADAKAPGAQLLPSLSRHGIRAQHETFTVAGGHVGKALLEQASRLQADLLVMGAYGHSRLREMILGGATRHVLSHSEVPVFMAH
jgi:nucleotide-binding universal stress UspA family protein